MGMFDTITISVDKLPVSEEDRIRLSEEDFQTKDLECFLNDYEILQDGSLYLIKEMIGGWEYKEVYKPILFHGNLRFYASAGVDWFEFNAKYTNGKLENIERILTF